MGAASLAYTGMVVRIIEGTGRGQELTISTNDQTTIAVSPGWSIVPDSTSIFVIAQASWIFAAVSATSPAQFEIAYQSGAIIQISGRGANVNNQESTPDLCPLTRWELGGGNPDVGLAGAPGFTLNAPGGGELTLSQVGFVSLANTSSVYSGTLQVFHWNELDTPSPYNLSAPLDVASGIVQLQTAADPYAGQIIQIGTELMTIVSLEADLNTYSVTRGSLASVIGAHRTGDVVLHLDSSLIVVPFATEFFENRASSNYLHTVSVPDVRVSAAQFYVTNAFGNSQVTNVCYANLPDAGLRTLSGGQFTMQISGYLATQKNAAPPLICETGHAVRDIRATVNQAATGYDIAVAIMQNGSLYTNLTISSGDTDSNSIVDGAALAPLNEGAMITLNITLNVRSTTALLSPGKDLTVRSGYKLMAEQLSKLSPPPGPAMLLS